MIRAKTQNIMLWDLHGPTAFVSKVSLATSEVCYIFSFFLKFLSSYAFLPKSRLSFVVCLSQASFFESYIDFLSL
jgi:hypothetical protein